MRIKLFNNPPIQNRLSQKVTKHTQNVVHNNTDSILYTHYKGLSAYHTEHKRQHYDIPLYCDY